MTKKSEQVFIQIGDERIELTGAELEAFETNRKAIRDNELLLETARLEKENVRASAINKLATIAGLTEEEINSII